MATCTLGNYRLLEKLGEGGMGAVYRGVDLMVEREVAIKMLRPEIARQPEVVERFRAEAVALAKLNHPNIATLYSFFREGDEYYMVMEFVAGQTLDNVIRSSPALPIGQAITISAHVLDAIDHAHTFGILHRDIKPANIMITGSGQVKVTDFGIARVLGTARMTREGCVCGTLEYLAPERIRGQEADLRSDLYSMGVVLYEMLTRHLPFERASTYELMRAHLEEAPPAFASMGLSSIPPALEAAVQKALAKAPEGRFATAREFRSVLIAADGRPAITPVAGAEPASLTLTSPLDALDQAAADAWPTPAAPAKTRGWKLYGAAAAALVAIVLTLAFLLTREPAPVEAEKPAAAPIVSQPSSAEVPLPPPSVSSTEPVTDSNQPALRSPEERKAVRDGVKTNSPVTSAAEVERRKAALKALEQGDTGKPAATKQKSDRKSSALKALDD